MMGLLVFDYNTYPHTHSLLNANIHTHTHTHTHIYIYIYKKNHQCTYNVVAG